VQGIVLKNEDTIAEILKRVEQLACSPAASSEPLPAAKPPVFELRPAIAPAKPPVYELIQDNHPIPAAPVYEVREDPTRSVGASGRAGTPASAACLNRESAGAFHAVEDPGDLEEAVQELKGLRPVMGRTELMERVLEGCELRAIKPAVQQVLSLTGSASASLEAISRAIRQDQALSLKVLQIANSPLYTRGERVETVQKAVSRIGVTQIRTTVLSLAVIDMLGGSGLVGRIHADWFWEHSIACGLISSRIARARGKRAEEADAMFTAGLLHDIGRLVLAERIPEEYGVVMEAAERLGLPLEMVESRLLMMNHAELSDRLLRQWNFSTALVNPIALHHLGIANIRSAAPRMSESVATIACRTHCFWARAGTRRCTRSRSSWISCGWKTGRCSGFVPRRPRTRRNSRSSCCSTEDIPGRRCWTRPLPCLGRRCGPCASRRDNDRRP
jgi:putative nucleotidyltransferase with HDIG domain